MKPSKEFEKQASKLIFSYLIEGEKSYTQIEKMLREDIDTNISDFSFHEYAFITVKQMYVRGIIRKHEKLKPKDRKESPVYSINKRYTEYEKAIISCLMEQPGLTLNEIVPRIQQKGIKGTRSILDSNTQKVLTFMSELEIICYEKKHTDGNKFSYNRYRLADSS